MTWTGHLFCLIKLLFGANVSPHQADQMHLGKLGAALCSYRQCLFFFLIDCQMLGVVEIIPMILGAALVMIFGMSSVNCRKRRKLDFLGGNCLAMRSVIRLLLPTD